MIKKREIKLYYRILVKNMKDGKREGTRVYFL